ncbi:26S proteasome regulatory subunit [Wickerhamomyces ciferrii]|uniref:26S proteasome regulatory subunit RPN8 n=1 Tax=Wickerhamomyces ciferrii (strain ATCC 14091 / BCRC 22168 / CBS 111 / JCM 3599 / NBRC 0793 / NRRL Y-1031 F-60-10) TaxID=1206466 RepID=K0KL75_WICCF|nr:26S proteasome regulatory subunit [Wickerhamomyces ciferrii]CCH42937.1 26S proteasome regulatory subunit [Wickerhamomyces ciferrii]
MPLVDEKLLQKQVSVAPLVLLSAVDHYNRIAKDTKKRVVGVILGDNSTDTIRISNSFAIPFEEDEKNPEVWFLDHNYIESMNEMFKKINAKERLIGWYHSGPKLKASDLKINEVFKKYTPNPTLLIVDVKQNGVGIPTDAYIAIEEVKDDGTSTEKTFNHIPSIIEAEEAEEIGVEHLLRDIRDQAAGSLSIKITNQLKSLQGLQLKLRDIVNYLEKVSSGSLPVNNTILGKLQDVFNLLPNLSGIDELNEEDVDNVANSKNPLATAFTVKTNDELMVTYISSLVRSIIAFHDLIENKIENKKLEEKEQNEALAKLEAKNKPTEEQPETKVEN